MHVVYVTDKTYVYNIKNGTFKYLNIADKVLPSRYGVISYTDSLFTIHDENTYSVKIDGIKSLHTHILSDYIVVIGADIFTCNLKTKDFKKYKLDMVGKYLGVKFSCGNTFYLRGSKMTVKINIENGLLKVDSKREGYFEWVLPSLDDNSLLLVKDGHLTVTSS
jgi:hypothetical protein